MRMPCVAGQFYEARENALRNEIELCFKSKFGPGLAKKQGNGEVSSVIVPHAGYFFSGACAAHAYKKIAESKMPETFILIGPNHFGTNSGFSIDDWETPLGIAKNDTRLVKGLSEETGIPITEEYHEREHSLEVQVPFLQSISKLEFKIAPLLVSQDIEPLLLGRKLYSFLKKINKKIICIISSDFTHYGPNYGYLPFTADARENVERLDNKAIEHILKYDAAMFSRYVEKTKATICGYIPILVFLSMMSQEEKKPSAKLLKYYTSGDIISDYKNFVGYASFVFER